jgi:hypothetical protein
MRVFTPIVILLFCAFQALGVDEDHEGRPPLTSKALAKSSRPSAPARAAAGRQAAAEKLAQSQRASAREQKINQAAEVRAEVRCELVPIVRREIRDSIEDAKALSREQTRKLIQELKDDEVRPR